MSNLEQLMESFVSSGLAVDVVLCVVVIELVILCRNGWKFYDALVLLLPAAFILIAVRAAILDTHWIWIVAPLALAFPAHLADLRRRKKIERDPR